MKTLLLALFFTPFFAHADFGGHWQGQGSVRDSGSFRAACNPMDLVIAQAPNQLTLMYHSFQCGSFRFFHDEPIALGIVNGKLMAGDEEVGVIDERHLRIEISGDSWIEMNLDGAALSFSQHLTNEAGGFVETRGAFARARD